MEGFPAVMGECVYVRLTDQLRFNVFSLVVTPSHRIIGVTVLHDGNLDLQFCSLWSLTN